MTSILISRLSLQAKLMSILEVVVTNKYFICGSENPHLVAEKPVHNERVSCVNLEMLASLDPIFLKSKKAIARFGLELVFVPAGWGNVTYEHLIR